MNDSFAVSRVQRIGNLNRQAQEHVGLQRPPADAMLQRDAFQKLHRNEGLSVLLANIVYRADIGMIQCGGRLGFALKTCQGLRIAGNILRQKLQRDKPFQPSVLSFIHHAHAAATEFLDDLVVRNGLSDK